MFPNRADPLTVECSERPAKLRVLTGSSERRRFLRRQSRQLARVAPLREFGAAPDEWEWTLLTSSDCGQIANISMNGVAFRLDRPLLQASEVWLRLECRVRNFAVTRSARVVRVVPLSDAQWLVTCRFDRCVPYADVVQLSHDSD